MLPIFILSQLHYFQYQSIQTLNFYNQVKEVILTIILFPINISETFYDARFYMM